MIDYTTAADIARQGEDVVVHDAWDFGDFYLFAFAPKGFDPDEVCDIGTIYPSVRKSDGKLSQYDITSDLDAFENAVHIGGRQNGS